MQFSFLAFFLLIIPLWKGIHATPCAVPPTFWCDDPSLAKECGVSVECRTYDQRVSGEKVKLTLLYEALCGGCRNFILNYLYPQIWLHLKQIVDLELVPYGNAILNGTSIRCQHGPTECSLNKLESCALNFLNGSQLGVPFVFCLEQQLKRGIDPETAGNRCFLQLSLNSTTQRKIVDCWRGPLGKKLQLAASKRTEEIGPVRHEFVPWILINNRSTLTMQSMQSALSAMICEWYKGPNKPLACRLFQQMTTQLHTQCTIYWDT